MSWLRQRRLSFRDRAFRHRHVYLLPSDDQPRERWPSRALCILHPGERAYGARSAMVSRLTIALMGSA